MGVFCHTALLEVFDGTIDLNPIMFRLLENRPDGRRLFRVGQRPDGNADHRRKPVGLPVDRRAAVWTKIGVDLPATGRIAGELFRCSGNGDSISRIEGADAEWRAGSALAIKTVTGDNQS
jgi:hypothetical protein